MSTHGRGKGNISLRKVDKILRSNGYRIERYSGDHRIYKNDEGDTIIIPPSVHKQLIKRTFKENNIKY